MVLDGLGGGEGHTWAHDSVKNLTATHTKASRTGRTPIHPIETTYRIYSRVVRVGKSAVTYVDSVEIYRKEFRIVETTPGIVSFLFRPRRVPVWPGTQYRPRAERVCSSSNRAKRYHLLMPYWTSSRVGAVPPQGQTTKRKGRNERYHNNSKKGITMEASCKLFCPSNKIGWFVSIVLLEEGRVPVVVGTARWNQRIQRGPLLRWSGGFIGHSTFLLRGCLTSLRIRFEFVN